MIEIILGALVALAIRDIFYEIVERYIAYRNRKNTEVFWDLLEDLDADDD